MCSFVCLICDTGVFEYLPDREWESNRIERKYHST